MRNLTKILLEFNPTRKNILPMLKKISAAFGYISKKVVINDEVYIKVSASSAPEILEEWL